MVETSGEWREERFYVLRTLERLEGELKEKSEHIAKHEDREQRYIKDLNEAHTRIRALQSSVKSARVKSWAATAAASFLGVVLIELLKSFLK